jgi:hypothetical protein
LLGFGCWFVSDVLEQGVGPVLKGKQSKTFTETSVTKLPNSAAQLSVRPKDVKLHTTEA